MQTIEPAPHEFSANLLFDSLTGFFAFDRMVKDADGSKVVSFDSKGETWRARLSYEESNILPPHGGETPEGTDWKLESVKEYRVKVRREPEQDPIGQQDFTAHIAPRWQGMKGEKSDGSIIEIPVPDDFGEGINVRLKGSNIAFGRYAGLFEQACVALGINPRHVQEPHDLSNIQDAERYVRVHREQSGPVHARDGPIASLAHVLESDRDGYRKVVQNDADVNGDQLPGYYHTVTLGTRRLREIFPTHEMPKEVKHYYARQAKNLEPDNPLAHPKVGASLQQSLLDDDETVYFDELGEMQQELDQTLLSVLADAGIDISPVRSGPFVKDAYFEPETSSESPNPVDLNISRIRSNQESVVVRHLSDGLAPTQWEALETLVADGGEVSPEDIAEQHERHVGSVRRALRKMDDLVHREYAKVELRSEHVAELVHDAVSEARESCRRAAETAGKALEAAERGLDESMSSFIAFCARHGIDVSDPADARMQLRFGDAKSTRETRIAIREGLDIWESAGLDPIRYREAQVQHSDGSLSDAWNWL